MTPERLAWMRGHGDRMVREAAAEIDRAHAEIAELRGEVERLRPAVGACAAVETVMAARVSSSE